MLLFPLIITNIDYNDDQKPLLQVGEPPLKLITTIQETVMVHETVTVDSAVRTYNGGRSDGQETTMKKKE